MTTSDQTGIENTVQETLTTGSTLSDSLIVMAGVQTNSGLTQISPEGEIISTNPVRIAPYIETSESFRQMRITKPSEPDIINTQQILEDVHQHWGLLEDVDLTPMDVHGLSAQNIKTIPTEEIAAMDPKDLKFIAYALTEEQWQKLEPEKIIQIITPPLKTNGKRLSPEIRELYSNRLMDSIPQNKLGEIYKNPKLLPYAAVHLSTKRLRKLTGSMLRAR